MDQDTRLIEFILAVEPVTSGRFVYQCDKPECAYCLWLKRFGNEEAHSY